MHSSVLAITPRQPDERALHALLWPWRHSDPDFVDPKWGFFRVGGLCPACLDPEWAAEQPERIRDISRTRKRHLDVAALRRAASRFVPASATASQAALTGLRLPDLARPQGRTAGAIGFPTGVPSVRSVSVERVAAHVQHHVRGPAASSLRRGRRRGCANPVDRPGGLAPGTLGIAKPGGVDLREAAVHGTFPGRRARLHGVSSGERGAFVHPGRAAKRR